MRASYFNFFVAVFCASFAVFGNQDMWAVWTNILLALINLWVGLEMYKRGQ